MRMAVFWDVMLWSLDFINRFHSIRAPNAAISILVSVPTYLSLSANYSILKMDSKLNIGRHLPD
jgi:hypothetical protein